ncbi:MAG: hypothetical protein R3B06_02145 [Kofleriaceae bacterium]
MRPLIVIISVAATAACAAPPMGFGTGARLPTSSPGHGVVTGRAGLGVGTGRQVFQAEASGLFMPARWGAIELGAVFTRLGQTGADDAHLTLTGGFPYLRPRLQLGRVSLAIGVAGFALGGGGGGFIGGVADGQLGYGTRRWSVYLGGTRQGFELTAERPVRSSSAQLRVGGEYAIPTGTGSVGVAVELYRTDDTLTSGGTTIASRGLAGGLKLTVTSPEFR